MKLVLKLNCKNLKFVFNYKTISIPENFTLFYQLTGEEEHLGVE